MAGGGDKLRILICSEDKEGAPILEALAKKLLRQLEAGFDDGKIAFVPPRSDHRPILASCKWRSKQPEDSREKVSLRQTIATDLESGFVIFHFDGDKPYASRASSVARQDFETEIVRPVRDLLRRPLRDTKLADRTEAEVDARLKKLLVFQPFYSIEAWLFYNTRQLRELCRPHELPKVDAWHADPSLIEELDKPKEHLTCGAKHNQQLATSQFPTRVALDTKKSFADTLTELSRCEPLVERLRSLAYPSSTSPAPAPLDSDDD